MKVLASLKNEPSPLRPSRVLGLLLCIEIGFFLAFIVWQCDLPSDSKFSFAVNQWILAVASIVAMLGWTVSSIVTIKNSVKQHTINTLLQSRLSATYMSYADKVNDHFLGYRKKIAADPTSVSDDPTVGIDPASLRYIMNYFEFIAVGIRHGDLHEELLRDSLAGIMRNTVNYSTKWIAEKRTGDARALSNLVWLHARWSVKRESLFTRLSAKIGF